MEQETSTLGLAICTFWRRDDLPRASKEIEEIIYRLARELCHRASDLPFRQKSALLWEKCVLIHGADCLVRLGISFL